MALPRCEHPVVIRAARADEMACLQAIEREAGELFRAVGMTLVADDEPLSVQALLGFQQSGRAWVAVDEHDHPVGYLLVDVVDGLAHVEQVSVHPAHGRKGRGRALVDGAAAWAAARGFTAMTLTTFRDVAWNGPYYERLGFEVLPGRAHGPQLRGIRQREIALGLDAWPRVAMRRTIAAGRD